jgi:hypothetical protein
MMVRCTDCGKVYHGGKGWKISKGYFSIYATCPLHSKTNPQKEAWADLRIRKVI